MLHHVRGLLAIRALAESIHRLGLTIGGHTGTSLGTSLADLAAMNQRVAPALSSPLDATTRFVGAASL